MIALTLAPFAASPWPVLAKDFYTGSQDNVAIVQGGYFMYVHKWRSLSNTGSAMTLMASSPAFEGALRAARSNLTFAQ